MPGFGNVAQAAGGTLEGRQSGDRGPKAVPATTTQPIPLAPQVMFKSVKLIPVMIIGPRGFLNRSLSSPSHPAAASHPSIPAYRR